MWMDDGQRSHALRGGWRGFLMLGFLSAFPAAGFCQGEHVASLEESLSRTAIRAPSIAPDGRTVAYLRRETNWKENEFVAQLWLVNVATGKSVQLTRGVESAGPGEWSPDGHWLAFVTEREANAIEPPAVRKDTGGKEPDKADSTDTPKPAAKQIQRSGRRRSLVDHPVRDQRRGLSLGERRQDDPVDRRGAGQQGGQSP